MLKLDTELEKISGIGSKFIIRLGKLNIKTVRDLLWHFPFRYDDFSKIVKIADLELNQSVTIRATVQKISIRRTWKKHLIIVEAILVDETGGIKAVWFNQPYIVQTLKTGTEANFAGKVLTSDDEVYLSNPAYEIMRGATGGAKHTAGLIPIYPETRSLTSKGIRFLLKPILDNLEPLDDFLPEEILAANNLPHLNIALKRIHFPFTSDDAERARKRFAFEDLFLLQLNNLKLRSRLAKEKAPPLFISTEELEKIIASLPFALTTSQRRSLDEILSDLSKGTPMNRLLQGDVGSGKTVVVAVAGVVAAKNGKQTAIMAPTEILARQHYQTLIRIFGQFHIGIGLLTGSESRAFYGDGLESNHPRRDLLKEIANGKIKIIIGTHALISSPRATPEKSKSVVRGKQKGGVIFNDLALVIVDEQHRFGVQQRAQLVAARTNADLTLTDADHEQISADKELLYKDLTYRIRGIAFNVKKQLGLGHKESVYQEAFEEELKKENIIFEREKTIDVKYNAKKIGVYRPDFVIEDKIILELKAEPYAGRVHDKQLWSYIKGSNYKLALLVNFSNEDVEIKRIVYESARSDSRRRSASSRRQSAIPHFLSMSATPIPRTLSLTLFGDLDLSIIDELPQGRKPILTKVVDPKNRPQAHQFIREQVRKGRQVFVIYPRIEPAVKDSVNILEFSPRRFASGWSEVKAIKEEYEKLAKQIFPDLRVGMLHGRMPAKGGSPPDARLPDGQGRAGASGGKSKREVMEDFAAGKIDILASTSVIEVGVDVPNATIMVIEGADRFGLAQLYQFRGRVGRGEHQSFCLLFTDSSSATTHQRLNALLQAKNGFELAEKDLAIRGPGQFLGDKQTGLPDIAMRALNNMELIKTARAAAENIMKNDSELANHPLLKERLGSFQKQIHLE